MSQWYVYLLRCADGTLYTGVTTDPERRVKEHNGDGPGARYTRARRPVTLAWCEAQPDRASALRREHAIKQLPRTEKQSLLDTPAPSPATPAPDTPAMSFASLRLTEPLLGTLAERGYRQPTPIQAQVIPPILAGRDVLATAQTGTGKTAGFALPLLQRLAGGQKAPANSVRALILVPTRELAQQVYDNLREYGAGLPLRSVVAYGGVSINPQMMALRRGADILVTTPGRLLDLHQHNAVRFRSLEALVLDEADRMLDLGFSRELDALRPLLPARRQTLLFSATFPDTLTALASQWLHNPVRINTQPKHQPTAAVKQWIIPVDKRRKPALFLHLLKKHRWPQVLVFAKTRQGADQLARQLVTEGIPSEALHGDRTQPARLAAFERFRAGELRVLVATDVAARGLDVEALPAVVNLDLPIQPEDYIHRIGRTGRAGAEGLALSLVCADEAQALGAIEALLRKPLPRKEESGFEPEHRLPVVKKPTPAARPTKDREAPATPPPTRGRRGRSAAPTSPDAPPRKRRR